MQNAGMTVPLSFSTRFRLRTRVRHRGNLRQMRHAENLPSFETVQSLYATFCAALPLTPASTSSKNQRRHAVLLRQHLLHGEHDSRQLATRGDLESGLRFSPTFADIKNRTRSSPVLHGSCG